ncbi:MAG: hypothetical protein GF320_02055 [Armatimonadia bacterium]|jgi:hypothetical protein|nr:hypothetical protein [Armatimonadia bacterium]
MVRDLHTLEHLASELSEVATHLDAKARVPWTHLLRPVHDAVSTWKSGISAPDGDGPAPEVVKLRTAYCRQAAKRAGDLAEISRDAPSDPELLSRLSVLLSSVADLLEDR